MHISMSRQKNKAFTLVELLIVIIIIAVLAAIAIPKFSNSTLRSKEAALKADLKLYKNAVTTFQNDTGVYPAALADTAATSAPLTGAGGKTIAATDWKGPYVNALDPDPVSGTALNYTSATGTVTSSAAGSASDGTLYSTW